MGFVSRQNEWGHPGLSKVREGCCLPPLLTCSRCRQYRQGGGSCLPFEQAQSGRWGGFLFVLTLSKDASH